VTIYQGSRQGGNVSVTKNGRPLQPRQDLQNHSPTGFEWGYEGSGPAQLALALLADYLRDDESALDLHQEFKRVIVANLPRSCWTLNSREMERAVTALRAQASPLGKP